MALEEKQFTEGLVSIVTPVYNTEEYLPDYLDSILRQTYEKLELILVDDGSEDRSAAVAKSWQGRLEEKGISCRILRTRHRNASAALGHGLPFVTGEYLIWPDSDDVLAANSIEIRVDFLKKHPEYSCVRSLSWYFDPKTKKRRAADEKTGDPEQEELFWDVLEGRTFVCCGCYMLRSEAFFRIYPDGKIPVYPVGQNFQMLLPFLYFHKCPTIRKELYGVAVRSGSHSRQVLTREQTERKYQDYERLMDDIVKICGITDRSSLKRIRIWKYRRRLLLARQYGQYGKAIKTFLLLTKWEHGKNVADRILEGMRNAEWRLYKYIKRKRLKGQPSILASNCIGTMICHDMKLPWNSPTVNLKMDMNDFVKFCGNMDWYLKQELRPVPDPQAPYPVGMLGDIRIDFVHYLNFEDAAGQWDRRKKRIDREQLFIMGCEKDGCTYETLRRFDRLPWENKVILTRKPYPEFRSAFPVRGFEDCDELGTVTNFRPQFLKRRYLDDFDYVSFLNRKGNRRAGIHRK